MVLGAGMQLRRGRRMRSRRRVRRQSESYGDDDGQNTDRTAKEREHGKFLATLTHPALAGSIVSDVNHHHETAPTICSTLSLAVWSGI